MRPSQLVTGGVFAGVCVGAGLWMCLQGQAAITLWAGAGGVLLGGILHLALMAFADRLEKE